MKAFEFQATLNPDGTIPVPPEVAEQLGGKQTVRVLLLTTDSSEEDSSWAQLTTEQFLQGYDASDAAYDQLSPR